MYQGKFDAKSRGQQSPEQALDENIRERDEANAAAAAKRAQRDAARRAARPGSAPRPAAPGRSAAPARSAAFLVRKLLALVTGAPFPPPLVTRSGTAADGRREAEPPYEAAP